MKNVNLYSWYNKGALDCLRALIHYDMIKDTAKPLEVGKKYSDAQQTKFINATIIKQCLTDREFLNAFLLQADLELEWSDDRKLKVIAKGEL